MPKPPPKKLDLVRREMPKQEPDVRRYNFSEVALGFTPELAMEEAKRCIQCAARKCVENCPVEIDIPGFIKCVAEGDFAQGTKILKEKNLLPAICGRVCPQEEQCEGTCSLGKKGAPIAAVITPIGISSAPVYGFTNRTNVSARIRNIAPTSVDRGKRKRWSGPQINLTVWGIIMPTKSGSRS